MNTKKPAMSTIELVDMMIESLSAQPSDIIPTGSTQYFHKDFVKVCVKHILKMELQRKMDPDMSMNPLELLGMHSLVNMLGLDKVCTDTSAQ